ncbi:MAG: type II toxin-antitoxin system PrlF family antitoxin [Rhizomicrobium sp.]
MPTSFEESSTITAKGQTTVPKTVRRALGVDCGGKIVFRVDNGRVTVSNPAVEHRDPALGSFLKLLEADISAGRNVRDLPKETVASLRRVLKQRNVDLAEPLEGDVEL